MLQFILRSFPLFTFCEHSTDSREKSFLLTVIRPQEQSLWFKEMISTSLFLMSKSNLSWSFRQLICMFNQGTYFVRFCKREEELFAIQIQTSFPCDLNSISCIKISAQNFRLFNPVKWNDAITAKPWLQFC